MLNKDADYLCPSVSRGALLCPENHEKRGKERGIRTLAFGPEKVERNRMKMTNKHKQVGEPDGFDEGTYRLAVCNQFFATSNKVVHTKTYECALPEEGAK